MKSVFVGYFRYTEKEFSQLWNESIFAIDANVLLNLYRYSAETRKALEQALDAVQDKVFITHQAAKEFLDNRLNETANQAKEYSDAIKTIDELSKNFSKKNRHPFLPEDEFKEFEQYSKKWVSALKRQEELLFAKLTEDEILGFVEKLFSGKTGQPFDTSKLPEIAEEGEKRYEKKMPPGYKDNKKSNTDDPYRKYGDLIVWKQIIEYAVLQNKSVIFITDDKKEDWWLEQSGRTISPRPELIREFHNETNQKFWMYTVDKFIEESARISESPVSIEVIEEIIKISSDVNENNITSIEVSQESIDSDDNWQSGFLSIHLNRPMKYATGTGKFNPRFSSVPEFGVELIASPYDGEDMVNLSFGCGITRDFNIHLRAKEGVLEAGDYVFEYAAFNG